MDTLTLPPPLIEEIREAIRSEFRVLTAPPHADDSTVAEWFAVWLRGVQTERSQATYERYRSVVRTYLVPSIGAIRLVDLAPSDVRTMLAYVGILGRALSTAELALSVLSSGLASALDDGKMARNVANAVTRPKSKRAVEEVVPPTVEQVRDLLGLAYETEPYPVFANLHLLAFTGLRRGEALGLEWPRLHLDHRMLRVTQTVGRTSEKGLVVKPPKTRAGVRTIDVDEQTVEVLRELGVKHRGFVFPGRRGGPSNPMRFTRAYLRLAAQVGMVNPDLPLHGQGARLHDLRHFHASVLIAAGVDLKRVSQRLGHADIDTTIRIYGHLLPGGGREAAERFSAAMAA